MLQPRSGGTGKSPAPECPEDQKGGEPIRLPDGTPVLTRLRSAGFRFQSRAAPPVFFQSPPTTARLALPAPARAPADRSAQRRNSETAATPDSSRSGFSSGDASHTEEETIPPGALPIATRRSFRDANWCRPQTSARPMPAPSTPELLVLRTAVLLRLSA